MLLEGKGEEQRMAEEGHDRVKIRRNREDSFLQDSGGELRRLVPTGRGAGVEAIVNGMKTDLGVCIARNFFFDIPVVAEGMTSGVDHAIGVCVGGLQSECGHVEWQSRVWIKVIQIMLVGRLGWKEG